jgi:diguanylate cyclase (GGDEF)-like protein
MFDEEELRLLTEMVGNMSFAVDHISKEERLNYLAMYDQLTGLANRTLFLERLNQFVQAASPVGNKVAVVLADIERLRTVNESLGRSAGDAVIKEFAERLGRQAGKAEVARIGSDHFTIMLQLRAIKGRSETARRIEGLLQSCFAEPFGVADTELRMAAKAGVTLFPNDGADAELLLRNAEAALAKAKDLGERYVFYTSALTARTGEKLALENQLRQALEKNEFVLHYQPKVDLETRRIVGVEALIRWQSPELGLVPPMKFIPLMEETGLILDVGAWALGKAIADHLRWIKLGLAAPRVAVNVSAIQLRRRDFVFIVEDALTRGATPPGVDLEITESLVMEDIEGNMQKLKDIRALGLSIAIDDFGTGYSSLGYLAKLPVQTLKIDRSFIITMLKDPDTMTLVQTIISLAHSLRLKVVAEGVDEEEQAKMLRLFRCDEMQGYLFSKPLPFEEITEMLASSAAIATAA